MERAPSRWQEAAIPDPATFYTAHPEAVVSIELWARLDRHLAWWARHNSNPIEATDLRAAVALRIIEAATGSRSVDGITGEVVYDYLQQHPSYIVQHAAIPVYSEVRRRRKEANRTRSLDAELEVDGGDRTCRELVDDRADDPLDLLTYRELVITIRHLLTPRAGQVFDLLVAGHDRGEIGRLLGLSRQSICDHIARIRQVTTRALSDAHESAAAGSARAA